jgi:DNA-binding response OmpR family regulator
MRIAVLEDDPVQAGFLIQTLTAAGHTCHEFSKGRALVHALRRQTFDLLVLDWMIPDLSGEEVLRWVRGNVSDYLPVIFITARNRETDMTSMLDAGADDYVIKPVSASVLLSRVAALLRRAYKINSGATRETFGDFEFDLESARVLRRGVLIPLTQREFTLAMLLFQNLGRPLSRAHILERVWKQPSDLHSLSRTLDTHISCVRTKLGLHSENGYRVVPLYGYGYRLERIGDVEVNSSG